MQHMVITMHLRCLAANTIRVELRCMVNNILQMRVGVSVKTQL
jgi:hypothetical protein